MSDQCRLFVIANCHDDFHGTNVAVRLDNEKRFFLGFPFPKKPKVVDFSLSKNNNQKIDLPAL